VTSPLDSGVFMNSCCRPDTCFTPLSVSLCRAVFKGGMGSPPKCSPQKFCTLIRHISAVAVVNIVTILSRSIAFSFHLKRLRHSKSAEKAVAAAASTRTPLGELTTLPIPCSRLGRGHPPQSPPHRRLWRLNIDALF